MIIPEWLYQEHIEKKTRKIPIHKQLKQTARENIKMVDKQFEKGLAKKRISIYFFNDKVSQIGFNIIVESHRINRANSKLTIKANFIELGIETRYNKKTHKRNG